MIKIWISWGIHWKYIPELCEMIEYELGKIDISGYKDSMIPLIKKDIAELRELIEEKQEI